MPYGSMLHILLTNYHPLAPKHEPYQKAYFLTTTKILEEFSGKKSQENRSAGTKRDKTERETRQKERQDRKRDKTERKTRQKEKQE